MQKEVLIGVLIFFVIFINMFSFVKAQEEEQDSDDQEQKEITFCPESQLKITADNFIISYVGEEYFNSHYIYTGINLVGRPNVVFYNITFNEELSVNKVSIYAGECLPNSWLEPIRSVCEENINADCETIWYARGVFETLEINISREDALEIAKQNNIEPEIVVLGLRDVESKIINESQYITFQKPYWLIQMTVNPDLQRTIIIDSITGEFSIKEGPPPAVPLINSYKNNKKTNKTILLIVGIILIIILIIFLTLNKKRRK